MIISIVYIYIFNINLCICILIVEYFWEVGGYCIIKDIYFYDFSGIGSKFKSVFGGG